MAVDVADTVVIADAVSDLSSQSSLASLPVVIVRFPIASQVPPQAPIFALPTQGSRDFPFPRNFPSSAYLPSILFSVSCNCKGFGVFGTNPCTRKGLVVYSDTRLNTLTLRQL